MRGFAPCLVETEKLQVAIDRLMTEAGLMQSDFVIEEEEDGDGKNRRKKKQRGAGAHPLAATPAG